MNTEQLIETGDYSHWPEHARPPAGWHPFGTHAALDVMPPLECSEAEGEDGLPLWERVRA